MPLLYYSTVVYLKYYIQKNYLHDNHYVWVSEVFNNRSANPHTPASLVPSTSNPYEIYHDLKRTYERPDGHSYKIIEQKASLKNIAITCHTNGVISETDRDEIIYMVDNSDSRFWRPVVYLIPGTIDVTRVKSVPIASRASFGPEYIIHDLKSPEFELLEIEGVM